MTTPNDKKSLMWLSKHVHPKLFEMCRVADTLTQGTDGTPPGTNSWRPGEVSPGASEMALDASFWQLTSAPNNPFMSCILQLHHPIKMS